MNESDPVLFWCSFRGGDGAVNLEDEKMRVIIDYYAHNFPVPYSIQPAPIKRWQTARHDDRKLRVVRDGKVAFTVIVSSSLLSDACPNPTKLSKLLKGKMMAEKLRGFPEFRLNHYELGTGEAAEYG
ncbi:MAG: hypothetical protein ACXWWE_03310 [Nitrospira sp.]